MKVGPLLLLIVASVSASFAQLPDTLIDSIASPVSGIQAESGLGSGVAVAGNLAAIGAPKDDIGAEDAGSVKVFDINTGALLFLVANPHPAKAEHFGASVAFSGSRLVIGVPNRYQEPAGHLESGTVYVYDLAGANPTVPALELTRTNPGEFDHFGASVTMEGDRVVVGAPDGGGGHGCAYVYDLASSSPTTPTVVPNPANDASAFGMSVALSGNRLLIAAPNYLAFNGRGRAFLYDLSGATPTVPSATITIPSGVTNYRFAQAIAISGDRMVFGGRIVTPQSPALSTSAGAVYVFDLVNGDPTLSMTLASPTQATINRFGQSVAMSGSRLVVGDSSDGAGAALVSRAFVYDLEGAIPATPIAVLRKNTGTVSDAFGAAVAISATHVVVGAPSDQAMGSPANTPTTTPASVQAPDYAPIQNLNSGGSSSGAVLTLGSSTLSIGGTTVGGTVIISNPGGSGSGTPPPPTYGAAYVFEIANPNSVVATLNSASPAGYSGFGSAMALSGDHVVTATATGHVYVHHRPPAPAPASFVELTDPGNRALDGFGRSVAIFGNYVVVGAPLDGTVVSEGGRVYLYDLNSATPGTPTCTLDNPIAVPSAHFGAALAISAGRMVIGSPGLKIGFLTAGGAFAYTLSNGAPSLPVRLDPPDSTGYDGFGAAVAVSGNHALVGAPYRSTGFYQTGGAFFFNLADLGMPVAVSLPPPHPVEFGNFGAAVALDGDRMLIGAPHDKIQETAAGVAYLYATDSVTPFAQLENPIPRAGDAFGAALAISGTRAVVGAVNGSAQVSAEGSHVYIYDLSQAPNRYSLAAFTDLSSTAQLGEAVAIDHDTVAVAAPFVDSSVAGNGAVYLFGLSNNTPPVVMLKGDQPFTLEAGSYPMDPGATATDAEDGTLVPFVHASDVVPLVPGSYGIQWAAIDHHGTTSLVTRTVQVVDTTAPVIAALESLIFEAAGPDGGYVTYPEATATDAVGVHEITYSKASGTIFPLGTTTVTVTARDAAGNASHTTFNVTVRDSEPPSIARPPTLPVAAENRQGAVVYFPAVPASDPVSAVSVTYSLASGSLFPVGRTEVTATARDAAGNTSTSSFFVEVLGKLKNPYPNVTFHEPEESPDHLTVTVSGTVLIDSPPQFVLYVNGHETALDTPLMAPPFPQVLSWQASGIHPLPGLNTIVVYAGDGSTGQAVEMRKTFSYHKRSSALAGDYQVLCRPASGAFAGLLKVTVTAGDMFSGKFLTGDKTTSFSGVLDHQGQALFSALHSDELELPKRDGAASGPRLKFSIDAADGLTATITEDAGPLAKGVGKRAAFGLSNPVPAALLNLPSRHPMFGRYNVALPSKDQTPTLAPDRYPQGDGCLTVLLLRNGHLTAAGTLADGTKFTAASSLRGDASAALFSTLYGRGFAGGELAFEDLADSDVSGSDWLWCRPQGVQASFYIAGWPLVTIDAIGTKYAAPTALNFGQSAASPGAPNAHLHFAGEGISTELLKGINLHPSTGVAQKLPASDATFTFSFVPATGVYHGAFSLENGSRNGYHGILLNKGANRRGFGYFQSSGRSDRGNTGTVSLKADGP